MRAAQPESLSLFDKERSCVHRDSIQYKGTQSQTSLRNNGELREREFDFRLTLPELLLSMWRKMNERIPNKIEKRSRRTLRVWLALGLGAGDSPIAPGTVGSLWGPILVWGLSAGGVESLWLLPVLVLLFLIGVPLCEAGSQYFGKKDPGAVVFDEIAAYPLVHLLVPLSWTTVWIGFILFRIFDILKPWPIKKFERLPGGWGVMADDIIAALYAMLAMKLIALYIL